MAAKPNFRAAGAMRPSETLARHREDVRAITRRRRAQNPRLFGSAARGQDAAAQRFGHFG